MTLRKKNRKDFSYSSRKQNDLGVPGFFFPVQKQVMRARLYYLSIQFQRVLSLKFLVKSHQKKFCQGKSVKGLHSQFMSTFKLHIRKEKDVLSSENTHTCRRHAGCVQTAPVWLESSRVPRELPGAGAGACTRSLCAHLWRGSLPSLRNTSFRGTPNFSEKRLIYNGDMPFQSQETPSALFLPFLSMYWDFLCFSFLF